MRFRAPRYLFRRYELLRRLRPGARFLEVGPGDFELTSELLGRYREAVTVDFSDASRARYEQLPASLRQRVRFVCGDLFEADLGAGFDLAVSCEVMEHVADDAAFLARLRSLLGDGGQLILSVPARQKYWSVHDDIVGHLRRYEREPLRALVRDAGFAEVEVVSYGFPFVNALRLLRVGLARSQQAERGAWDQQTQTKYSNFHQIPASLQQSWLGLLTNPVVVWPLGLVASAFNRFDLSDGYLVFARAGRT